MTEHPPRGVLVAGHICVDLIPGLDGVPSMVPGDLFATGPIRISSGGSVANTAGALRMLGVPVTVAADVGDDVLGTLVVTLLDQLGLDTSGIRTVPGSTSYSVVVQPPGEDRTFWHHVGVNATFDGTAVDIDSAPERHRILHIGYPPLLPALVGRGGAPLRELLRRARAVGLSTSLDMAVVSGPDEASRTHWRAVLRAVLPSIDICSPSRDDLRSAVGRVVPDGPGVTGLLRWAQWLVEQGCRIAVVSGGVDGFAIATAAGDQFDTPLLESLGSIWHAMTLTVPAHPVGNGVLATTGAGDAASAGLLAGILDSLAPADAVAMAADTAARRIHGRLFPDGAS